MKAVSLSEAALIYECCDQHRVQYVTVEDELARSYSLSLLGLQKKLGQAESEPYWNRVLSPFRRYRFAIAALPLRYNAAICIPPTLHIAIEEAARSRLIYPQFAEELNEIAGLARRLTQTSANPLIEAIVASIKEAAVSGRVALLIKDLLNADVRKAVAEVLGPETSLMSPASLAAVAPFDHLVVLGPLSWYPQYLRTAPRHRLLTSVRYTWIRDKSEIAPSFMSSAKGVFCPRSATGGPVDVFPVVATIDATQLAPAVDWKAISWQAVNQQGVSDTEESIDSRLLALCGGRGVLVYAGHDATVQVIDATDDDRVVRIPTEEVEPGMHILLRTGGGGDFVVPVADRILGPKAGEVRAMQLRWKKVLSDLVKQKGEGPVAREIAGLGSSRATRGNLRNWMNERSIRPDFDEDFLAVLLVCKLDDHTAAFMANAKLLDRVHRRAGFQIRQMLLRQVKQADLVKLSSDGVMEFRLPAAIGGSFTAYRIEDIAPETVPCPSSLVGHVFKIREGSWRA